MIKMEESSVALSLKAKVILSLTKERLLMVMHKVTTVSLFTCFICLLWTILSDFGLNFDDVHFKMYVIIYRC